MAEKRVHDCDDDDDDSDDDFGPKPISSSDIPAHNGSKKKKMKKLEFENLFLQNLPTAQMYEHSFMHRDIVTHIAVSKSTEFVITGSRDGHVKFWKKMPENIEFVKHFQAHLGALHSMELSGDGLKLVTTSQDKMIKFFEVISFDMSNMIDVEYTPTASVWINSSAGLFTRVCVADASSSILRLYSSEGTSTVVAEINIHSAPVR